MTEPMPGGRRRVDRVLAPNYLDGLRSNPLEEVRALRKDAEQCEADLSYLRRLLHARIDILCAELDRRAHGGMTWRIVDELAEILSDQPPSRPGPDRHLAAAPSRVGEYRRTIERFVADVGLSDVAARTEGELRTTLEALATYEKAVSRNRRAVHRVVDACGQEIARRYRTGQAQVTDLLSGRWR